MELSTALRRRMSSFVPAALREQVKSQLGVSSTKSSLLRIRRAGFDPHAIIDIGAYEGEFTVMCKSVFPRAQVLMIEPLPSKQQLLRGVAVSLRGVDVRQALLGSRTQSGVGFHEAETASSVLSNAEGYTPPAATMSMTTLDALVVGTPFEKSDFLKLDVQGYELQVLQGGARVLATAQAVLLETNLLEIYEGAPLIDEVVFFMKHCGLQMYDVGTVYRRPYDDALWQMDVLFVRSESQLLASRRWA
jgi:FkbM family methyltransferase